MIVYKPPQYAPPPDPKIPSVFLAGSIDMGAATEWQKRVEDVLSGNTCAVYNPRRDDWDSTWVQDISNPNFKTQVNWELDHLALADVKAFYFDPNGPAPVTLLEFGMHVGTNCVVYCPPGYWRRGNIQVVCDRVGIPVYDSEEEFTLNIRHMLFSVDET